MKAISRLWLVIALMGSLPLDIEAASASQTWRSVVSGFFGS
jgi:hypothetical protein